MRRPLRSDEARGVANLAIDLGDPGRMSRARRMHRANAVAEVEVTAGVAHATVTDPSGEIHEVSIAVGDAPASASSLSAVDLRPECTCEDDGDVCTHSLAALLGIAEEIEANARLLELWAGGTASNATPTKYTGASAGHRSFFEGAWATAHKAPEISHLDFEQTPVLVVDDLDAGPVILDAVKAIRLGLSGFRAQQ